MGSQPRVIIIGAGPTGLGAAWRLQELGHANWVLYEASNQAGGLASSIVDKNGFTWDMGGHVLFSHYEYFDRLMEEVQGNQWVKHVREAWVWMRQRWIPYPLQNNIWRLPSRDLIPCLEGLLEAHRVAPAGSKKPESFGEWLSQTFGEGLCEAFMFPYNRKVWAYDPYELGIGWMKERVSTVDMGRVLRNLVLRKDDVTWGPNATFRFPLRGGTGAIWSNLLKGLPQDHIKLRHRLATVNAAGRSIMLQNGCEDVYDYLISTIPLEVLLQIIVDHPNLSELARPFVHSSTHIIGVGLQGQPPDDLKSKCWIYFPEPSVPFYRATVFSNYSPYNVACPGKQWSLMAEVSESEQKPVNINSVVGNTIAGFRACRFMTERTRIVSVWHRRLEHGYPTPWLGRDDVLGTVDPMLTSMNIYSRGRFGGWKYEVANQDHSVMQGVEAIDHILSGSKETTYHCM